MCLLKSSVKRPAAPSGLILLLLPDDFLQGPRTDEGCFHLYLRCCSLKMLSTHCCREAACLALCLCLPFNFAPSLLGHSHFPSFLFAPFHLSSLWPPTPFHPDQVTPELATEVNGRWVPCDHSLPPTELVAIWYWYRSKTRGTKWRLESEYSGSSKQTVDIYCH